MGCDIHLFTEYRYADSSWNTVENEPVNPCRNYTLFATLAGVRIEQVRERGGKVTPVSEPRGLPQDSLEWVRELADNVDCHSHSYITAEEYEKHVKGIDSNFDRYVAYTLLRWAANEWRLVFWFDN